jgi:hypothetical protein
LTEEYMQRDSINHNHKGLLCTTAEIYKETGNEGLAAPYEQTLKELDPNYKCGLIAKVSGFEREAFA